jgi:hypothetical protein
MKLEGGYASLQRPLAGTPRSSIVQLGRHARGSRLAPVAALIGAERIGTASPAEVSGK